MKTAMAVRYDEIKGKVVAGAGYSWDKMLIAFTDGTVLALAAEATYYGGSQINFERGCDIDLQRSQWVSEANDAGLITREEWLASLKERDALRIKRLEHELASLKAEQEQTR